jgi:hypothetical protein
MANDRSYDIAKIFQSMGFKDVTPYIIDACNAELFAEVQAIKRLPSQYVYPYFAKKAPFLVEQFQDWWISYLFICFDSIYRYFP